jgi:response regulator of citrate/malate metabolism
MTEKVDLKPWAYSWKLRTLETELKKVTDRCVQLEEQIKLLNKTIDYMSKGKVTIKITDDEYRLPDTLDRTITALKELKKEASASEISEITKRQRAVESHYLCILEKFGIVASKRYGKVKKFSLLLK